MADDDIDDASFRRRMLRASRPLQALLGEAPAQAVEAEDKAPEIRQQASKAPQRPAY